MQLFKHLTANNIELTQYNFLRELSMEAYLIENRNVLILDNDNFSDIEILDVELSLKYGRKIKKTDGRIDILAIYDQLTLAIIELKLGELNQLNLEQLEDYLSERNQILDIYRERLEIENNDEVKWIGILVGSSIDSHLEKQIKSGYLIVADQPIAALTINRYRGEDNQIYVLTETYFKNISRSFDKTKYKFNNQVLGKNRLVHALIKKYVEDHPKVTYSELEKEFPKKLQGTKYGVFGTIEEAQQIYSQSGYKRHFIKPEELIELNNVTTVAVCSQWGIGNIENILNKSNELGYNVEKIES